LLQFYNRAINTQTLRLIITSSVLQIVRPASYQPGSTVLTYEEELNLSPDQPDAMQAMRWSPGDSEGSSSSEGSHATGDSGRYSHDETEMTNLSSGASSSRPSLSAEDSGGSDCSAKESGDVVEESLPDLKLMESVDNDCCHHEAKNSSQDALSLQVPECV